MLYNCIFSFREDSCSNEEDSPSIFAKKATVCPPKKRVRDEEEASFVTCKIFHLDFMKFSKMPCLVKLKT